MANLIESLIAGAVERQDEARLTISVRPAPNRPRQVLELFSAMGPAASFPGLRRSIDLKVADPATMVFAVLGRWPTPTEAAAFADPYEPWPHLLGLLRSAEFRSHLPRITCDAFPERRRLLFVRIPASFGARVVTTLDSKHPVLPTDLASKSFNNAGNLAAILGTLLGRMNVSNALALIQPRMAAFCDPPDWPEAQDPLAWHVGVTPCRPGDLLFAMFREPTERALASVNARCAAYRNGDLAMPPELHARLRSHPTQDVASLPLATWQNLARAMLGDAARTNPVCKAIADGTADGALAACRRVPLQLVAPDQFRTWGRTAFDIIPPDPDPEPEPILTPDDLTAADRDAIAAATAQDRILHDRFLARQKITGLPSVNGREM
jgi:hypothetical protein